MPQSKELVFIGEKCSPNLNKTDPHPEQRKTDHFLDETSKGKTGILCENRGYLGKCSVHSQMMFYSENDGSKPGRALAVPLYPLEKGASFHLLRIPCALTLK